MRRDTIARWLKIGGVILLGIYAGYWFLWGFADMSRFGLYGLIETIPAVLTIALMFIAWKHPLAGGILLVIFGLALTPWIYSVNALEPGAAMRAILIFCGPLIFSGIIFLTVRNIKQHGK